MKIKGHTSIELKNVKTGEIERYEDDNMVTNALNYYLQDMGVFNISPLHNTDVRNNLIPQLLGGLLLFDTPLTENADNIICPSGVKMVGNGAYNHSSGSESEVTEMGTYDQTESRWTSDGKCVMVWNFATSQANCAEGQSIRCACLTSANHGYIGEGNANSDAVLPTLRNDYSLAGTPNAINIDGGANQGKRIVRASRTTNTITMIDEYNLYRTTGHDNEHMSETGKVKLTTYKMPFKTIDMRFGAGQQYIPTAETEITLPGAFVTALNHGNPYHMFKMGDTYCMVVGLSDVDYGQGQYARWGGSTTLHLVRINADNSLDYYAIANPEGQALDLRIYSMIVTDHLVFSKYQGSSWFLNLETPADIWSVERTYGNVDLVYIDEDVAFAPGVKIDIGEKKIYLCNSNSQSTGWQQSYQYCADNKLSNSLRGNGNLYKTTNYLATINNLAEPVVKTAEKTMKVTYILNFN